MIEQIKEMPSNAVGFVVRGEVTKEQFDEVIMPAVKALVDRTGKLNYLMQIDTALKNFTAGAWWKDLVLGIQQLTKWHRAAIITDSTVLNTFTDVFSIMVPGEFKGFLPEERDKAIAWVSEEEGNKD